MSLTSRQRRHLRALAHHLDPLVLVGDAGVTDGVIGAVDEALARNELVKVKLGGDRDARREGAETLAARTRSEVAQQIGRVVLLYRPAAKAERRRITLPE